MADEAPQRIVPMLAYADAAAALEFLREAFGFEIRSRMDMPDGRVGHAEVGYQGNVIMLASVWREGGMASPRELASSSATRRRSSDAGPTTTTCAPSASTRARLTAGASEGMTIAAGTPRSRAARATPCAWLPEE